MHSAKQPTRTGLFEEGHLGHLCVYLKDGVKDKLCFGAHRRGFESFVWPRFYLLGYLSKDAQAKSRDRDLMCFVKETKA